MSENIIEKDQVIITESVLKELSLEIHKTLNIYVNISKSINQMNGEQFTNQYWTRIVDQQIGYCLNLVQ